MLPQVLKEGIAKGQQVQFRVGVLLLKFMNGRRRHEVVADAVQVDKKGFICHRENEARKFIKIRKKEGAGSST